MIWTIATREVVTRGRSKGFLAITAILFVALIAAAVAIRFLGGGDDARSVTIGITRDGAALVGPLAVGDEDLDPTIVTGADVADLENGEVDVLFDGAALTWDGSPDRGLDDYIRRVVQEAAVTDRAAAAGLGVTELGALFEPVELEEVRLDGGAEESDIRFAAAAVSAIATFMLLQVWGSFMMMGVIEEKSSKVIEVLLSQIRPATLLGGKILGLGILAVGQMLIVVIGLVIGLALVQDIDVPSGVWATAPLLLVTFVLGFGFYATAFAAVGSMVSRQEDATSAQLPAMLPLFIAYFIAVSSLGSPGNPAVTIGSFIPFTSPVLLPLRTANGDMPGWQVALALAILAVSIFAMLQLAGRIYRYSLLRSGARVSWGEAWRNRNAVDL
ncbi:MAG: ABC transporter permease [Actinomycetota bacterium]